MAKIYLKHDTTFIINNEIQQVVIGPGGPQVVTSPSKTVKLKAGTHEITDKDTLDRIRRDSKFNTSDITEISADDIEAIQIKEKKLKEADEEIVIRRKSRVK